MINRKMNKSPLFLILTLSSLLIIFYGCSTTSSNPINPANPSEQEDPTLGAPVSCPATPDSLPDISYSSTSRELAGIYTAQIDIETNSTTVTPNRNTNYHFSVLPYIAPPIIYVKSWDPVTETVDVDVSIRNTSPYTAYDVRLIIFTDTAGHRLLNPDNYTHLWDIPQGDFYNGFKAYAKENTNRVLNSMELKTENLQIKCPNSNFLVQFAVDASWPSNCEEPYEISNFTQGTLHDHEGASSQLHVDVIDWQENTNMVVLMCSQITDQTYSFFTRDTENTWTLEITNNTSAPPGDYTGLIAATSSNSPGIYLLDEVTITVTETTDGGWARTWGGVGNDRGQGIAVDQKGNIYATGSFASVVDFNPDPFEEDVRVAKSGPGDAFLVKYNNYGDFIWVRTWGSSSAVSEDTGYGIDIDSAGNIFICGTFFSTCDFDPGDNVDEYTSNGQSDIFLVKYNPVGDYQWAKVWGSAGTDSSTRLKVDAFDNAGVTGYFEGIADFDPAEFTEDWHESNGGWDAFISKFDNNGNLFWVVTWGGLIDDRGHGIANDSFGDVYCAGQFEGTVDFDPGDGTDIHSAEGTWEDAFLSKFDSDGNFEWAHAWGSGYQDEAADVAIDEFDDAFVTGSFYYTVDFNPDPLETEERTAVWEDDVFVSKFAPDGNFIWVLAWGAASYDVGWSISTTENGYFCVVGDANAFVDLDPGPDEDIKLCNGFLSKFDINGNYIWGHGDWASGSYSTPKNRALDTNISGDIFLTGIFQGNADFDPGPDLYVPAGHGGCDTYIIKLLPNGYWE